MKRILVLLGLVVVVVLALVFATRGSSDKEGGITLVPVARGTIVDKALATGQIEPVQEIQVKSQISGIVQTCFVDVGDAVAEGDRLLEIVPNPTPLELTEAERSAELAEIGFHRTEAEHQRVRSIWESGLISRDEYDAAVEAYDGARVERELAGERLDLIREGKFQQGTKKVDSVIRSPAAGTVLQRFVDPGDPVVPLTSFQAGTELLAIADMDRLIFEGTVDEIDVGKLEVGLPVRIHVGALPDVAITGTLARIAPKATVEDGSTLFDVEVSIDERGEATLRAGYSANADIIINEKSDVLLVPERLLLFEGEKVFVDVPGEKTGDEPVRRELTIGLSDGLQAEILSGLEEGEMVVQRPPREI